MLLFPFRFCPKLLSSELESIGGQLQLFDLGSGQPAGHAKGEEDIFMLLEDLQEAICQYQVCLYPDTLLNVDKDSRSHSKQSPTIKDLDR